LRLPTSWDMTTVRKTPRGSGGEGKGGPRAAFRAQNGDFRARRPVRRS
jgi:hypothetical protein